MQSLNCKGSRARSVGARVPQAIYLNLVEGSAKPTRKDKRKFFYIAMGSLRETQALLDLVDAKKELELADKLGANLFCLLRVLGSG